MKDMVQLFSFLYPRISLTEMAEQEPIVFVVDDDAAVRNAMDSLIRSVGLKVRTFVSANEFLRTKLPGVPSCLVLDVRMPGMSGLDLHRELAKAHIQIPVIFITGHGDVPMAVRVMKAGAVEFLTKPFRDQDLLDSIQEAIQRDRIARQERIEAWELHRRFSSLTPREREVMQRVVDGLLNKQIAAGLGISETTVKVHRGQVMQKMMAGSVPELVRMAAKLVSPQSC